MSQDKVTNVWTTTEIFIDQMCTFQIVSSSLCMSVHTEIFDYLIGRRIYESSEIPPRVRHFHVHTDIRGSDVYHHIKFCLQDKISCIIQNTKDMANEDIFRLYARYWDQYKSIFARLNAVCNYVNRHWVVREHNSGRHEVLEIGPMSQQIWEQMFFQPLFPKLIDACFDMIKSQRAHQIIDIPSLTSFIEILNSNDFNTVMRAMMKNNLTSGNVYKDYFEARFLRDVEDFYHHNKISYDETDSLTTYLNRVAERMVEEIEYVQSYLPESTKSLLINIIEEALVRHYQQAIRDEMKTLLENDKSQDLTNLFQSIRRMRNTKLILIEVLQNHIQQIGINAIKNVHTIAIKEPKVYVDTILDVYTKCLRMIKETFDNDLELITAFKKTCQYFVNNNSITESRHNKTKVSELLVQYCDTLLRNSGQTMNDIEFEETSHQIMLIFDFIEDKDIFEKLYGKMFAKRLINQLSVSIDYEKLFVTKLQQICGAEYTSKLERMIYDIDTSQTINNEYQNRQQTISIDFSIMILSSNSWSLSRPPHITLPNELTRLFDEFLRFYNHRHNGRKLMHLYQYSKGELQTYFTPKKYTFQGSMYQMIVLLLFNQSLTWTVEQISHETQIQTDLLVQILNSLIKSNLLLCPEMTNEELKEDNLHHTIQLSVDYKNEKMRSNLNIPRKSFKEKETKNLHRTMDDDRRLVIQAMIVRIMKERKTLKYSLLMQNLLEQINARFKPDVTMIKKCIEILIEKNYLQRQSDEKDVLNYIP